MADFSNIIQEINEDITTNGVGAITGAKLNEVLRDMIAAVNAAKEDLIQEGYIYGGVAKPWSIPSDDKRLFYLAQNEGTYDGFDGTYVVGNSIVIFKWSEELETWTTDIIGITQQGVDNAIATESKLLYTKLGFDSFSAGESYSIGDYITYLGVLYRFNTSHNGTWDDNDVDEATLLDYITDYVSNQLSGKQDTISDLASIRSGAAAGATAYQKPSTGIPKTDLASGVQTSLGKADTAVQPSSLATVATSGSYNDLLNTPTIPAAQVNSDWNANSGVAQILNKPTIPAAQVQSDWDEADNTKVDYIKNKPTIPNVSGKADKVVGATSGDVATLDGTGNLTSSGLSVFDFFVMVEDASTPPASMAPNNVYQYGTLAGNTTFPPLATPTEPDIANVYCWTFTTPATAPTITWPSAITSWAGGSAPTINASKSYEVSVMDGLATIIEN